MPNASMERMVKNLDRRVTRVEQILPTLTTKKDLDAAVARLATKEELRAEAARLATKEELRAEVARLATKEELRAEVARLATKEELRAAIAPLATKEELRAAIAPLATKEELRAATAPLATREELRQGLEETRQFTRVLFESLQDSIRVLAEGLAHLTNEVREMKSYVMARFENHEVRLVALESGAPGRRRRTSK